MGAKLLDLDSEFDLVMVSDLMDESLVLLADLLCLPLHAVTALKMNAQKTSPNVISTSYLTVHPM